MDVRPQREYTPQEVVASPIGNIKLIMITAVINAKEG